MNFWLALVIGAVIAGIFGILIGVPSLGLKGDYLAIATLGFGEIIRAALINETWLTRGPLGIPGIVRPELFGISFDSNENFFILSIVLVVFTYIVLRRLTNSSFGRVLKAIREDEVAALSIGKDVNKYKLISMGIGAFFAGISGALFAFYITFIDPSTFVLAESVLIVSMAVLGGLGRLEGSIIGAIILVLLPEPLRAITNVSNIELLKSGFAQVRMLVYSVLLIVLMIKRPEGIMGKIEYFEGKHSRILGLGLRKKILKLFRAK